MLKLSNLGAWIQERLNDTLAEYINNNADTRLKTDRMVYAFKVYTDQGKHKGFDYIDHNGNVVNQVTNHRVRYIECQLSQNDSTVEATGYVSVTRNTILEILIPLDNIDEVGYEEAITEEIRTVIDTAFNTIGDAYITEDNQIVQFGFKYSLSNTGIRTNRPFIGDSISMTAYINFFFVESGISANDIQIFIDGVQIIPLRYGFNRGTSQQSNTYSDDNTMTAKNTPTSSLFSFNFDTTARRTPPLISAMNFAFRGLEWGNVKKGAGTTFPSDFSFDFMPNVAHFVEIKMATSDGGEFFIEKYMIFENVSVSGALPLLASLSVTMTEVKVVDGLTPLSDKAAAKYYNTTISGV